jgi:uncharacterized protein YlaN (UPF0358 family)
MLSSIKNAFGDLKNAAVVKIMKSQLANLPLPADQKKMFEKLLDTKPELLMQIATEIQEEMKKGKTQLAASQSVMLKYRQELAEAMR